MSEKLAKTICRYAQNKGHKHLRLEKKGNKIVFACGNQEKIDYLHLNENDSNNIAETFRCLVGAADNELFADKHFKIADEKGLISGRATLLPAEEGEKLLITLNSINLQARRLSAIGMNREQQKLLKKALNKKRGVIIIAAKPENGATSTYYSLLNAVRSNKSVYSLESYPSISLPEINTINPRRYGGITAALDKILRLDSDIIGIDADISPEDIKSIWRSAASGRLIIATIAAENAAQALKIIKKTGLSSATINAQLSLLIAQKLFSRSCPKCLRQFDPGKNIKNIIKQRWPLAGDAWPKKLYSNHGCKQCRHHQRLSKTAIFEMMHFLDDGSLAKDYRPLIIDALEKAGLGLINIEDIAAWADTNKKL